MKSLCRAQGTNPSSFILHALSLWFVGLDERASSKPSIRCFPPIPEFMVALAGFPEHPVILLPRREHCFESPKAAQKGDSHENVR